MYYNIKALILNTKLSSEADKVIVAYTNNIGKIYAVVPGAKKIIAKLNAATEPITESELIIYQNGERFEIGKIKKLTDDGAFVYYHEGDTASKTPYDCMHKIINAFTIKNTSLGGGDDT